MEQSLLGQPADLPGIEFLNEELLPELQSGDLSIAGMRLELLKRTPVYFVGRFFPIQASSLSRTDR